MLGDTLLCVMHTKSNRILFNLNEAHGVLFHLCNCVTTSELGQAGEKSHV